MKIYKYITILTIGLVAFACSSETDTPTLEDHFMAQPIPQIPVEIDYTVGAFYNSFGWDSDVPETPTAGNYESVLGDPVAYESHVDQAIKGGIDYFLFRLRSNVNTGQFTADKAFVDRLQTASNASSMNFAFSYNFGVMGLNNNNNIESKGYVDDFINDFELMLPYMQQSNYMKIDGKVVVQITNGHNLFSEDNAILYDQLRTHMSGLGVDLYLIANQQSWTPPLRYDFRFVDGVDAVSHNTYIQINISWYDRYIQYHKMCEQAWGYSRDKFAEMGLDYVPTLSPSRNPFITNPNSKDFEFMKDPQWFSDMCNVGRVTTGSKKLIFIDSFNDWNFGSQLESATSYGEQYLDILRQEFKVN